MGLRHRVTGVNQVDEIDTFDDAAVFDIETGNNAFGKHVQSIHDTGESYKARCLFLRQVLKRGIERRQLLG